MPYIKNDGEVRSIFTATRPLSTAVTYSDPINIERYNYFGLWISGVPQRLPSAAQLQHGMNMYDILLSNFICR